MWGLTFDQVAFRRSARAALVIPLAFLFARLVLGDPHALIFIVFGRFALLVMADFSGPRRARSLAYLGAVLGGAILVARGTRVSAAPAGAAIASVGVPFGLAPAA